MIPHFFQIYLILPACLCLLALLGWAWYRDWRLDRATRKAFEEFSEGEREPFEMTRSEMDAILGFEPDPDSNRSK